jgi:hypothetical protein
MGEVRAVIEGLAYVIQLAPHSADVHAAAAGVYERLGWYHDAVEAAERALSIDPIRQG